MEENDRAVEDVQQNQAQDVSPTSDNDQVKEPEQDSSGQSSSADESSSTNEENVKNSTNDVKPRRAERRVKQLLGKLKGQEDSISQNTESESKPRTVSPEKMPWERVYGDDTTLIREGETEIDPQELIRRQENRERVLTEKLSRDIEQKLAYNQKQTAHFKDVEETIKSPELDEKSDKYDSVLDKLVAKQYELENRVYNPYTGTFEFVPNRSMSEIFNEVKSDLEANGQRSQAHVRETLHEVDQNSAVNPSQTSNVDKKDYEGEALYEKAKQSSSTDDWAAYLKKRI